MPREAYEALFNRVVAILETENKTVAQEVNDRKHAFVVDGQYEVLSSEGVVAAIYKKAVKQDAAIFRNNLHDKTMLQTLAKDMQPIQIEMVYSELFSQLANQGEGNEERLESVETSFLSGDWDVVAAKFQATPKKPKVQKVEMSKTNQQELEEAADYIIDNLGSPKLENYVKNPGFLQFEVCKDELFAQVVKRAFVINKKLAVRMAQIKDLVAVIGLQAFEMLISEFTDVYEEKLAKVKAEEEKRRLEEEARQKAEEEAKKQEMLSKWEANLEEMIKHVGFDKVQAVFNKHVTPTPTPTGKQETDLHEPILQGDMEEPYPGDYEEEIPNYEEVENFEEESNSEEETVETVAQTEEKDKDEDKDEEKDEVIDPIAEVLNQFGGPEENKEEETEVA